MKILEVKPTVSVVRCVPKINTLKRFSSVID
jgi:hypothetical protein